MKEWESMADIKIKFIIQGEDGYNVVIEKVIKNIADYESFKTEVNKGLKMTEDYINKNLANDSKDSNN